MATKILMPSLGMYTIEGELTRWLVPNGTAVGADQAVLELTTEKSTVEINSPAAGILQHAAAAGDVVLVEALLGYVLAPGEAPPAEDVGGAGPAAAGAGAAAAVRGVADAAGAGVTRPEVGSPGGAPGAAGERPSAARGAASHAGPVSGVAAAQPAAAPGAVSQAGAGQPAGSGPAAGAVRASPAARKRAKELGVELGWLSGTGPGGRITEADVQMAASSLPATSAVAAAPAAAPAPRAASATERGPAGVAASGGAGPSGGAVRASPAARKRAKELGVELGRLSGTGPGGRITEADVETAASALPSAGTVAASAPGPVAAPASGPARAAAPAGGVPGAGAPDRPVLRRVPLSGMRRVIAARMHSSLANSAQLTLTRETDASPLIAARQAFNAAAGADPDAPKVAFDVLLAKALATALGQQPALNAIIDGDEILLLDGVHVGIAVAVEDGLLVPVLRDAGNRPVRELAAEFARLAECAREGKLTPPEYEGGTVTITNLGGYGIDTFTPILNPPESAILGVGRIAPRPFVASAGDTGDTGAVGERGGGAVTVRPTVHLSLTFDHRVADGAAAAQLLDALIAQWPGLAAGS